MSASKAVKNILDDINKTIAELQSRNILLDDRHYSTNCVGKNLYEISYPGKNDASSIVYDKHVNSNEIMETLLKELQYNILFYDKGLIQAEFVVDNKKVLKERLVFMKKHNKVWNAEEIAQYESKDEDWFAEEEGVPIMLRVDYAPDDHVNGDHAATHLTISNHESCRIPIKGIVTFSEFVRFVLFHFYNIKMELKVCRLRENDTITELERKMIHMNWD